MTYVCVVYKCNIGNTVFNVHRSACALCDNAGNAEHPLHTAQVVGPSETPQ